VYEISIMIRSNNVMSSAVNSKYIHQNVFARWYLFSSKHTS